MRVKIVFDDWRFRGESIYQTEKGLELSSGDFHSGTTFDVELSLRGKNIPENIDLEMELLAAIEAGYSPVFYLVKREV